MSGDSWAPDLSDFMALVHGKNDIDLHDAFIRCLNKNPIGRAEIYVSEKIGFNVRSMPHEVAQRMHKKFLIDAIEKDIKGVLKINEDKLKGLPSPSVKSVTDIAIEEYDRLNGKKIHPRIQKIIDSRLTG